MCVFVGLGPPAEVAVGVGVLVGVGVEVRVGVDVGVLVGVEVGVAVGGMGVAVGVGVGVAVAVGVGVGVTVGVGVGVAVGTAAGFSGTAMKTQPPDDAIVQVNVVVVAPALSSPIPRSSDSSNQSCVCPPPRLTNARSNAPTATAISPAALVTETVGLASLPEFATAVPVEDVVATPT